MGYESIVDWPKVVTDLQRAGLTWQQQAREIGVCRRTIGNWQHGSCEPSFSCGYQLLEIYKTVFGTSPVTGEAPPLLAQVIQRRKDLRRAIRQAWFDSKINMDSSSKSL